MRVALVHDWLNQYGGAERVLEVLHDLFPDAPIYTSFYAPETLPDFYRSWDIRTSFLQRVPLARRRHQPFLPFYPFAFQSFDLSSYDLVISNSSGFCHGVPTKPQTCNINYCLTPPRFLWDLDSYLAREEMNPLAQLLASAVVRPLRWWDQRSVRQVDHFVAISQAVRERIARHYGREAAVIYPPVHTSDFQPAANIGDFYLVASRLIPYKRIDLAVRAFTQLGLPLLVVGEGRDRAALQAQAGPTVQFEGWVSQERLRELMATCKAFIFPGAEDFGIAPMEAQASGRPVIAYAAGGALDTVEEGVTGVFFHEATPASLAEAVQRAEQQQWDSAAIHLAAQQFDVGRFRESFMEYVHQRLQEHQASGTRARSKLGAAEGR